MVRVSNNLIGVLNIATLLLSIPIIGGGVWLGVRSGGGECGRFFDRPVIFVGVFLLVVSLSGLVGACCRVSLLLWIYLVVMFLLIVALLCFTVFAFVVTNRGAGEVVSGRGYKEYRLGDYSNWLRKRVDNSKNWPKIKSCLQDGKVCGSLQKNRTLDQFISQNLSPIQSGCCKPPTACNFTYRAETLWDKPAGITTNSNVSDCATWQNDPKTLCFECESCRAGVLANIKKHWKKLAIINIAVLIFLIVVYSVGCCAFRNNRESGEYPRYKRYH